MQRTLLLAAMLCPLLAFTPRAKAATWSELLVQAQAADELGAALSASADRATFEAARLTTFLRDAGVPAGLAPSMATRAKPAQRVNYRELFDHTVARIKKAEGAIDRGADP